MSQTNEFQQLVYLLNDHYSGEEASVTESRIFEDPISGNDREVDVCIEQKVGDTERVVSVECIDWSESTGLPDVTWVEAMTCKHNRLPTTELVLVSRSGFGGGAKQLAEAKGYEMMMLEEISVEAVSETFGELDSLYAGLFQLAPQEVLVYFEGDDSDESVESDVHRYVFDAAGNVVGTVKDFVFPLLRRRQVAEKIAAQGEDDHRFFVFGWEVPETDEFPDLYMKATESGNLQKVRAVEIHGDCRIRTAEFTMQQGLLGKNDVVWGHTDFVGGEATLFSAISDEDEKFHLRVVGAEEWPPMEND